LIRFGVFDKNGTGERLLERGKGKKKGDGWKQDWIAMFTGHKE
jgi:hypothetical protein